MVRHRHAPGPRPGGHLRLLAGAVFLSAAGDLLALVTLALQVHALTGSAAAVSALFAATLVPMVALAPLAGLAGDRWDGRRVLVVASLAQAAVAGLLAAAHAHLAAVLVLAALLTAGNAFSQPAEFTLVPRVAGGRKVVEATGVVEAARYAGFAAGPALAAVLATAGPHVALLVNAATFLAIAAAAAALPARAAGTSASPDGAAPRPRALDGVRVLRGDRVLRVTVGTAVVALLLVSVTPVVEVLYVRDVVGGSSAAYALVVCAWMAGMVVGATALARRVPTGALATGALVALAVQGAGIAAQTAVAVVPAAVAGFALGGLGHGVKNVLVRTLLTERVPDGLRARTFAAYNAARNAAEMGATAGAGLLVALLGARGALLAAGALPAAAALAAVAALRATGPGSGDRSRRRPVSPARPPRTPARGRSPR